MKRAFLFALLLLLVVPGMVAQIKVDQQSKLDRIEGTVQSIDSKNMTFVIRERGTANLDYTIVYNDKTAFTFRNAKSTISELKDGRRIIALGKAEGATKLIAQRVDIRD